MTSKQLEWHDLSRLAQMTRGEHPAATVIVVAMTVVEAAQMAD
jgi:hypothetical protein